MSRETPMTFAPSREGLDVCNFILQVKLTRVWNFIGRRIVRNIYIGGLWDSIEAEWETSLAANWIGGSSSAHYSILLSSFLFCLGLIRFLLPFHLLSYNNQWERKDLFEKELAYTQ